MTFYKIREQAPPDSLGGRATLLLLSRVLVDSFRGIKSKLIMKRIFAIGIFCLFLILASSARAQTQASGEPALPYIPSLDVSAMDKSIDPMRRPLPLLLWRLAKEESHSPRSDFVERLRPEALEADYQP